MLRDTYAVSTGAFIDVQKQNDDSSSSSDGGAAEEAVSVVVKEHIMRKILT
jgi:hypothetical protein